MPVISACHDLFPDADCPWTLVEISERLEFIESGMNYDRVYRAWQTLLRNAGTRALVLPISDCRPLRFGIDVT